MEHQERSASDDLTLGERKTQPSSGPFIAANGSVAGAEQQSAGAAARPHAHNIDARCGLCGCLGAMGDDPEDDDDFAGVLGPDATIVHVWLYDEERTIDVIGADGIAATTMAVAEVLRVPGYDGGADLIVIAATPGQFFVVADREGPAGELRSAPARAYPSAESMALDLWARWPGSHALLLALGRWGLLRLDVNIARQWDARFRHASQARPAERRVLNSYVDCAAGTAGDEAEATAAGFAPSLPDAWVNVGDHLSITESTGQTRRIAVRSTLAWFDRTDDLHVDASQVLELSDGRFAYCTVVGEGPWQCRIFGTKRSLLSGLLNAAKEEVTALILLHRLGAIKLADAEEEVEASSVNAGPPAAASSINVASPDER